MKCQNRPQQIRPLEQRSVESGARVYLWVRSALNRRKPFRVRGRRLSLAKTTSEKNPQKECRPPLLFRLQNSQSLAAPPPNTQPPAGGGPLHTTDGIGSLRQTAAPESLRSSVIVELLRNTHFKCLACKGGEGGGIRGGQVSPSFAGRLFEWSLTAKIETFHRLDLIDELLHRQRHKIGNLRSLESFTTAPRPLPKGFHDRYANFRVATLIIYSNSSSLPHWNAQFDRRGVRNFGGRSTDAEKPSRPC